LISPAAADTYRVFVDKEFGFFGVRSNNTTELVSYSNRILYVDIGDKVVWDNYVITNERISIISDNKLWSDTAAVLGWNTKIFSYTFNKTGTYKFHVKENTIFNPDLNMTDFYNSTIWFKNQVTIPVKYQTIMVGINKSKNLNDINTTNKIQEKKRNKIIASNTAKYSNSPENSEEDEYEEILPQVTAKIEKVASPYDKYTILELLKSILART